MTAGFTYAQVDIGKAFPFGNIKQLGEVTSTRILPAAFSIATALVVIFFVLGAFRYLRAGDSKEEVNQARQLIQHSIFGFILLILIFVVIPFLLSSLFGIKDFSIIK